MEFSSKNCGVGCHSLLQEIFPTQGLNLGLLPCRQILYQLNQQGSLDYYYAPMVRIDVIFFFSLMLETKAKRSFKICLSLCSQKGQDQDGAQKV